jgi:hypothetical protein
MNTKLLLSLASRQREYFIFVYEHASTQQEKRVLFGDSWFSCLACIIVPLFMWIIVTTKGNSIAI